MKILWLLSLLILTISCKQEEKKVVLPKKTIKTVVKREDEKPIPQIQYSEKELIAFMDSIAKLPLKPMMDKAAFQADSLFKSQTNIGKQLSLFEFKQLKQGIKKQKIDIKFAERIFGKFPYDSMDVDDDDKSIAIILYSFDKNKDTYDEFAICLGWPGESMSLYFFKSNLLLSKINIHWRYDFEPEHYKDSDGKTIVYYKENYDSGTGIWWYNYYFYKYDDGKLIPILNEIQESNLQFPWGFRVMQIESTVKKTNPLTLRMVYYQKLSDTLYHEKDYKIVKDCTLVTYHWNKKTKILEGDYAHSKISKAQILTYYHENNELLFIHTYHKKLKSMLTDPEQKKNLLYYLNSVKNEYGDHK